MLHHSRTSWKFVLLLLVSFLLAGCGGGSGGSAASASVGSTAGPAATGNGPQVPAPANTVNQSTDVTFQFVLQRAVPSAVTQIEFTGFDSGGQAVFGPVTRPKAATIVLQNVPVTVVRFQIRLLENGTPLGTGQVTVSLNAGSPESIVDPDFVPAPTVTGITVTPGTDNLLVGQSRQLVAVQNLSDGSSNNISNSATWSSSSPGVASVNSQGLVSALTGGQTTITATQRGLSNSATITVTDPSAVTGIAATPDPLSLVAGTTGQLSVQATLNNNTTVDVSSSATYLSQTPAVAQVNAQGLVTAVSPGTSTIQISHQNQSTTVTVQVSAATLQSISLNLSSASLQVGQSATASVTGRFSNGTSSNLDSSASLSSNMTGIAQVSGLTVSAVAPGSATITATVNGVQDTAQVQVVSAPASAGLARMNFIRNLAGLPGVTENPVYSQEAAEHSLYMVKNDFIGHSQDRNNPFFTEGGDRSARNSNVAITSDITSTVSDGIDQLMQAPFHGVGFIDPQLLESGFGHYCEDIGTFRCGTTIDVLRGRGALPAGTTFPILWPRDGATMPYTSYTGGEFPDPLTGLPGFTTPTGAPIYVMFGSGNATINVTSVSLRNNTTNADVTVGSFDETNYTNSDAGTQSLGRNVLGSRDALVIMTSSPLTPGHNYTCQVVNNGVTTRWSFTVSNTPSRALVAPSVDITR